MYLRRRFAPFALLGLSLLAGGTLQLAAACPPGARCPMVESAAPPACQGARLTSTLPDCCVAPSAAQSEVAFVTPPAPASMTAPAPAVQPAFPTAPVAGLAPSPLTPPPAPALYTLHAALLI